MIVNNILIDSVYIHGGSKYYDREDLFQHLLPYYEIDTDTRLAYFLAQLGHESGEFRYRRELIKDADAERRYGCTRKLGQQLGNYDYGDGARYKGRGFIQLTGKNNYIAYSNATGVDFVTHPEWIERDLWALHSACWYWHIHKLNDYADKGDFKKLTRSINGGYNGLAHRQELLNRATSIIKKMKRNGIT